MTVIASHLHAVITLALLQDVLKQMTSRGCSVEFSIDVSAQ